MRRAIIAVVAAATLTMSGLTFGPALRATALGETSVTLNCNDDTSITLLVDANMLAGLIASVQAMIDYPAGLDCTLVQNPIPLGVSFGHVARAATASGFIVDGGRWLVGCSVILGDLNPTMVPGQVMARAGARYGLASRISPAPLGSTPCPDLDAFGCIWINIGVNLHVTGSGKLEGTLNETIPENQSCTNANEETFAIGPSHFTSKPTPPSPDLMACLHVNPATNEASVITYVTQISGLEAFPGTAQGFFVRVGDAVRASFFDSPNSPSQQTPPGDRDMLNAPPAAPDSDCTLQDDGAQKKNVQQNGNVNVHP